MWYIFFTMVAYAPCKGSEKDNLKQICRACVAPGLGGTTLSTITIWRMKELDDRSSPKSLL